MMNFFITISCLFVLANSAPTHAFVTPLPTVQIRTIGLDVTHYTSTNQSPSNHGHIITLVVGIALSSFAQNPLLLQGIEIVDAERDGGVYCKVLINNSSDGVVVSSKDGMVMLDGDRGSVVKVTGLSCGFGAGSV
jgi:hypothetical protein